MSRVTQGTTLNRLKKVIAMKKRGLEWTDVYVKQDLRATMASGGLGYNETGLESLTKRINKEFKDEGVKLKSSVVRAATTVGDLNDALWKAIPAENRKPREDES